MDSIKVLDKTFKRYVSCEDLDKHVAELAAKLNHDFAGKEVLFLGILNGSFIFASDLIRKLDLNCQITFVKLASYEGTESTGEVRQIIGLNENIKGKTVIIIEDIVDSGLTLETIIDRVQPFEPEEIKIATMFFKPNAYKRDFTVDYVAMTIPNDFIIGYGLDYEGYGRNLKDLYTLDNSQH
ncbi:MAG: hypoxanthine phosphoribosyltransferase [Bacteroidales bacterium]|nr:hypoxanthine phosphoribosyltransferase [Bacteroidales bacterium]